jgi:hypothetical protein
MSQRKVLRSLRVITVKDTRGDRGEASGRRIRGVEFLGDIIGFVLIFWLLAFDLLLLVVGAATAGSGGRGMRGSSRYGRNMK